MPMNAFLLQDIPTDIAEYAARTARSARRGVNDVLVEMLARAIALEEQARAVAESPAALPPVSVEAAPASPPVQQAATEATAQGTADAPEELATAASSPVESAGSIEPVEPLAMDPESVALREAMLAAQSIPRG